MYTGDIHEKIAVLICAVLILILTGCQRVPETYEYVNQNIPILKIELIYHPWVIDDEQERLAFEKIRDLEPEEVSSFMNAVYELPTRRARPTPPSNYGLYIARVFYENGDVEYLGSSHVELVEKGTESYAVGYYYFPGDAFTELFLEYAGDIGGITANP